MKVLNIHNLLANLCSENDRLLIELVAKKN